LDIGQGAEPGRRPGHRRRAGQPEVAAPSEPSARARGVARSRDLERLEGARIGRLLRALDLLLGLGLVREARALHGGRRVAVVEGGELLPQRAALPGAEATLERVQQLRLGELAPAARAEDRADDRGGGEQVGHLPVPGPLRPPEHGVFGGHLGGVQASLGDVLVDARHVVQGVVLQPAPAIAVEVVAEVELALVVGLGVGGARPLRGVHRAVRRRPADEGGELRAPEVAQHVDEEQAVLCGGVARAEHRAAAGGAVDVRDPEAVVAQDRHVGARGDARRDVPRLDAEGRVLVVAPEVLGPEPRRRVHEVAVHRELVVVVGGARARGQEGRELDAVGRAAGAGREHVVEAARVVRGVRLHLGVRRRRRRHDENRPEGGDERPHRDLLSDRAAA
jgi:hypothetical protein